MAVVGEESSFYNYTKEWIVLVDRGGLFHVNDGAYAFFKAVEVETRHILPHHLTNTATSHDAIFEVLKDSKDIQFYWTMVLASVLMITPMNCCRQSLNCGSGYSLTATWMEQYKRASQKSSSKTEALRKDLRKPDTS